MNSIEDLRRPAACEGSDCAGEKDARNDWFGDLAVSEEPEDRNGDQYGDRY